MVLVKNKESEPTAYFNEDKTVPASRGQSNFTPNQPPTEIRSLLFLGIQHDNEIESKKDKSIKPSDEITFLTVRSSEYFRSSVCACACKNQKLAAVLLDLADSPQETS